MTENPEKKIIVDEDWKTQVEREREAARKPLVCRFYRRRGAASAGCAVDPIVG